MLKTVRIFRSFQESDAAEDACYTLMPPEERVRLALEIRSTFDPETDWPRWRDCIELLHSKNVDFLIVGALATAWHGHPHYTADMDMLILPDKENTERARAALRQFGLTDDDLNQPGRITQLGMPPNRIDLITSITGVDTETAWTGRVEADFDGCKAFVIGIDDLLRNKESTGRPKDMADAAILRKRHPRL